jgi:hypothetical protein
VDLELPQGDRLTLLKENDGSAADNPAVDSTIEISWDSKYEFHVG